MIYPLNKNRITYTCIGLIIALGGISITTTIYKLSVENRSPLTILILEAVIFLLLFLLLWIVKNKEQLSYQSIGFTSGDLKKSMGWGLLSAIACGLGAVIILVVLQSLGLNMKGEGKAPLPLWVTGIVILRAGIVEEIFFRGYAIDRIERLTNTTWVALLVPLLIFSLLHYGQGVAGMIVTFGMGGILTFFYLRRRNVVDVIIAHFTVDLIPNIIIPLLNTD